VPAAAAALPLLLARAGYRITATPASVPDQFGDPATIERLAADAHDTWADARTEQGWVRGAARRDEHREHPDLLPYCDLADERREIDRALVRAIPSMLAQAGRGLAPITPEPLSRSLPGPAADAPPGDRAGAGAPAAAVGDRAGG